MLSAKFKIILIVFGVLIGLFFLQYMVTSVASANNASNRREMFENPVDDTPNGNKKTSSVEKKEETATKKTVTDKEVKLSVLEHLDEAFTEMYPDSEKKPMVFEMLTRKEEFDVIKERYTNNGDTAVGTYVRNFVKRTMKDLEREKLDQEGFVETDDEKEKIMNSPINMIVEKMDQETSANSIASELDGIMLRLKDLKSEVEKLKNKENEPAKAQSAAPVAKKASAPVVKENFSNSQKPSGSMLVEGFENRLHYASY